MSKKKIPTLSDIVSGEVQVKEPEAPKAPKVKKQVVVPDITYEIAELPDHIPERRLGQGRRASTTVYITSEVKRQLEELQFAERHKHSQNDIFMEGLDRVFKNRGLKSIKELEG